MATTTIKVSVDLRDRIGRRATGRGVTVSQFIEELLDAHERAERFAAFGQAFAGADSAYQREVELWDTTSADGRNT
ncbi:MAG: hypothetical protein LBI33_03890 [Propionibacteriaceae bacterium]|jgi:hypothetical protein|nr:hypothetical protein [Propionibacteriaceae bacterium]